MIESSRDDIATPGRTRLALVFGMPLVFALLPSDGVAKPSGSAESALTREERERIAAGELLTRPLHLRRSGFELIGGTSWQRIDAPIEVVWRALGDVEHYPNMLPAVREARIVAERSGERSVFVQHVAWPFSASYYVRIEDDDAHHVLRFRLDNERAHGLKAGWGFVQLTEDGPEHTVLAFAALADVGSGLLGTIAQSLIQPWMLRVPSTIKHYLESGGANLYVQATR